MFYLQDCEKWHRFYVRGREFKYLISSYVWNANLTYIQIFIPIFKYLDLGTNHVYLSLNHLYLASNHLHLGTNDLKIGTNDLYLGSNDLYLSSNTTICT